MSDPARPRVLQMGPDPWTGFGGMPAAMRGLLSSGLSERYQLDVVPTYRGTSPRGTSPLLRIGVFTVALARLMAWSLAGRGRIVHIHATVRGSAYRKAVCVLLAKLLRRRVVLQVHSGAGDIAEMRARLGPFSLLLIGSAFRRADAVAAVSRASAEALRKAGVEREVVVVPNAVPLVDPPERRGINGEDVHVVYLGGFENLAKGGDLLLEALALTLPEGPPMRVTLAGPGPPEGEAARTIEAERALTWAGWLDPEAKDELLRSAEVFVMPSRSEGLPMALLEAMAYGMAVLATEVGGIPELIEPGEDGLLAPAEDPEALADGLRRLVPDDELRRRLGAAARARVERLDGDEVAGRLARIYAQIIA